MIQRFHVQNFKALKDVTLDLTPIHVLIGANDTGKTSILEAIAALSRSCDRDLPCAFVGTWEGTDLVWLKNPRDHVTFRVAGKDGEQRVAYKLECCFNVTGREVTSPRESVQMGDLGSPLVLDLNKKRTRVFAVTALPRSQIDTHRAECEAVARIIGGAEYFRWNASWLGLAVAPNSARRLRLETSGFGLASCLDDILGYDRNRFADLERRFIQVFPTVRSIVLKLQPGYSAAVDDPQHRPILSTADGKGIWFRLEGGLEVSAAQVSDGMLLVLAYITLLSLPQPPRILLLEEPENGVHPQRLRDLLSILKELVGNQTRTQVILTTHSPMLIDLFSPEEVTLCRKNPDGSVAVHRLSESQTVREQMDVFTLGEIWAAEGDEALAKPISEPEAAAP